MRRASYGVTAADGRTIDISVVLLGAQAGSELDNVNRWRNELKLAPITEAELPAATQPVSIGTVPGKLYEMVSSGATLEGGFKERTLAATLSLAGSTVFFKLRGEDALALENKPKFLAWLKSVQTGPAQPPAPAGDMASQPVAPPPATGTPQWTPPAHWQAGGQRPMRLASFAIPNPAGDPADLSISALGGAAGGLLANINRWRQQQLGLPAATEADLATLAEKLTMDGSEATLVDFTGTGGFAGTRMLAAIVSRGDRTWFFKLTGDEKLLAAERENFVGFLKSVKFP